MLPSPKCCCQVEMGETNFPAALLGLVSSFLAIAAILNNSWIVISDDMPLIETNTSIPTPLPDLFSILESEPCSSLGTRMFWRSARFGAFNDHRGRHIVYHAGGQVLVDCINETVADFFYALVAVSFVIVITSSMASLLSVFAPSHGFLQWLRRNTVLEVCSMVLSVTASVLCLLAECQIADLRPDSRLSFGPGLFLILLAGIAALLAATLSLRRTMKRQRARRIDNQRLLCARSLRSWRNASRRPSDARPIVDFERYLESSTSLEPVKVSSGDGDSPMS